jgi:iodothyronine deiodinase-like protein
VFYVVYIAEAHPSDIWQMQSNIKEHVIFKNPTTSEERRDVATSCVRKLHINIPALIDGVDNQVERQYTAWPDRLFVIDRTGNLRYKSEPGPFGFDTKKLEASIKTTLGFCSQGRSARRV